MRTFNAARFWLGALLGLVGVGLVVALIAIVLEAPRWGSEVVHATTLQTAWTAQSGRFVLSTDLIARKKALVPTVPTVGRSL